MALSVSLSERSNTRCYLDCLHSASDPSSINYFKFTHLSYRLNWTKTFNINHFQTIAIIKHYDNRAILLECLPAYAMDIVMAIKYINLIYNAETVRQFFFFKLSVEKKLKKIFVQSRDDLQFIIITIVSISPFN